MAEKKRQHFVPRMYLDRFANDGQVFVRRRVGEPFESNCINVAVESGFYDVELPDGTKSKRYEDDLGDIEDRTAPVLRKIDDTLVPPDPQSEEHRILAVYLAVQLTRTPEERQRVLFPDAVSRFLDGRELTRESVAEYLKTIHLGFKPRKEEVEGAFTYAYVGLNSEGVLTREFTLEMIEVVAEQAVPHLRRLHWTIEIDRKGRFMTSDSPLILWRKPTPRDEFEGVGIATAEEIRFPFDPTKQLVLTKTQRAPNVRVTPERVAACNADVALACHNFIVSNPRDRKRAEGLDLPRKRALLRFNLGPLMHQQPDGRWVKGNDVMHAWVPRR
jgi:hypothetical protein